MPRLANFFNRHRNVMRKLIAAVILITFITNSFVFGYCVFNGQEWPPLTLPNWFLSGYCATYTKSLISPSRSSSRKNQESRGCNAEPIKGRDTINPKVSSTKGNRYNRISGHMCKYEKDNPSGFIYYDREVDYDLEVEAVLKNLRKALQDSYIWTVGTAFGKIPQHRYAITALDDERMFTSIDVMWERAHNAQRKIRSRIKVDLEQSKITRHPLGPYSVGSFRFWIVLY